MKKIELKSLALVDNFTSHSKIKNDLLLLMKDQPSDKLKDIVLSISELGDAVIAFEKLLKLQEEMQ